MQQAWDDIRRTVVSGLDTAHTIEKRLGKEVTPETINRYLEAVNHTMPGGAVVQEHMAECSPALTADCYVKVFSGNDELMDEIDKQFRIDINKEFPADQAKQLKEAIGNALWQKVACPTIVGRVCDGGTMSRWSAMQISMAFITSYRLAAGEAAIADFAFAAKHAVRGRNGYNDARSPCPWSKRAWWNSVRLSGRYGPVKKYPNDPARMHLKPWRRRYLRPDLPRFLHVRRCWIHPILDRGIHRQHPGGLHLLGR